MGGLPTCSFDLLPGGVRVQTQHPAQAAATNDWAQLAAQHSIAAMGRDMLHCRMDVWQLQAIWVWACLLECLCHLVCGAHASLACIDWSLSCHAVWQWPAVAVLRLNQQQLGEQAASQAICWGLPCTIRVAHMVLTATFWGVVMVGGKRITMPGAATRLGVLFDHPEGLLVCM